MIGQQQLPSVSRCGRVIDALLGKKVGETASMTDLLDGALPLDGGSHRDVVEYLVVTPLRYAECVAVMRDGGRLGLQKPRQFVGWATHSRGKSLLFRSSGKHLEIVVDDDLQGRAPGSMREILLESRAKRDSSRARNFIATDGGTVALPALPASIGT